MYNPIVQISYKSHCANLIGKLEFLSICFSLLQAYNILFFDEAEASQFEDAVIAATRSCKYFKSIYVVYRVKSDLREYFLKCDLIWEICICVVCLEMLGLSLHIWCVCARVCVCVLLWLLWSQLPPLFSVFPVFRSGKHQRRTNAVWDPGHDCKE